MTFLIRYRSDGAGRVFCVASYKGWTPTEPFMTWTLRPVFRTHDSPRDLILAPRFWLLNSKKRPRAGTARGLASQPTNSESRLTAGLTQASDLRLNLGITLLLKRGQCLLLFGR